MLLRMTFCPIIIQKTEALRPNKERYYFRCFNLEVLKGYGRGLTPERNRTHIILLFWVSALCKLAGRCGRFGETYCLHLQGWSGDAGKASPPPTLYKSLHFPASSLQPWRWKKYVSPKRLHLPTILHGAETQKSSIIILTAVKTSNPRTHIIAKSELMNRWRLCVRSLDEVSKICRERTPVELFNSIAWLCGRSRKEHVPAIKTE
jgi:hypothetical protein